MIRIIKRGTRQQATCDECGCVFSYEEEDIKRLKNHNGEYGCTENSHKDYVICPQCNNEYVISQTRSL